MPTHRTSVSCSRPGVLKRMLAGRHLYEAAGRILMPAGRIPMRHAVQSACFAARPGKKCESKLLGSNFKGDRKAKQTNNASWRAPRAPPLRNVPCASLGENVAAPKNCRQTKNEESPQKCGSNVGSFASGSVCMPRADMLSKKSRGSCQNQAKSMRMCT